MGASKFGIFLALGFQFHNAVKPFMVFAAVPYGAVGALVALWIMGAPFGFMGFPRHGKSGRSDRQPRRAVRFH